MTQNNKLIGLHQNSATRKVIKNLLARGILHLQSKTNSTIYCKVLRLVRGNWIIFPIELFCVKGSPTNLLLGLSSSSTDSPTHSLDFPPSIMFGQFVWNIYCLNFYCNLKTKMFWTGTFVRKFFDEWLDCLHLDVIQIVNALMFALHPLIVIWMFWREAGVVCLKFFMIRK